MGHSYVTTRNDSGNEKIYLFSGEFSSVIRTSSFAQNPFAASYDGVNTPLVEPPFSTEKMILLSGQFGSTVKTSLSLSIGLVGRTPLGISWDGANTPWAGADLTSSFSKLFLQSGQFSSIVKTSLATGSVPFDRDVSYDGVNSPRATDSKLFLQSGQFTSTVKDSVDVSAVETDVTGINFNGVNTPWAGNTSNGKFYLQSGQLTSTIKTSLALGLGGGAEIGGIDTTGISTGVEQTGTLQDATFASDIVAGGKTIILTLVSARLLPNLDTWDATIGSNSAATTALLNGIVASGAEANGWNNEVAPVLNFNHVVRTSDSVVTITLPAVATYVITLTETVGVTVPAAALTTGAVPITAQPAAAVQIDPAGADTNTTWAGSDSGAWGLFLQSGQFTSTVKASLRAIPFVVNGVTNDFVPNTGFIDSGATDAHLHSGQFTSTVKASISMTAIDSLMFGISWDLTNTPVSGNTNDKLYLTSGQFTTTIKDSEDVSAVDNTVREITWDGTNSPWVGDQANKLYLQSGQFTSTIKTSQAIGGVDTAPRGISFSATTGDTPWQGAGTAKLYLTSGQFSSTLHDSLFVVPIAAFGGTGIDVGDRLGGGGGPASATLAGTIVEDITEQDIRDGGKTILLILTNDTWVATAGADNAITQAIIDGLVSSLSEATGWNAIVKAGLNASNVERTADTILTIILPAFTGYDISADETITATVPASALTAAAQLVATPTFDITFIPVPRAQPRRIISADQLKEYVTFVSPNGDRYPLNTPHQFGRWVISYSGLGTPPIDYITQRGPFQDGVTVKDFFLGPRLIQLLIRQEFCDRLDWWDGRAALLDAIRPNRQLTATGVAPGALEWCLPDGTRRQINTFITEGPQFEPRVLGTWDENAFQEALRFVAHDPLFFDPTEVVSAFVLGLDSDLVFPITFPIQFGSGEVSDTLNLTYVGTWKTFPTIVIVGPLENPIITNVTTGEKLEFAIDIPAGRTITIDLAYGVKTVVNDLGANLIGNLSADSNLATWHLAPDPEAPGGLNVITLTGLNPTGATSVQLRYFTRYFGF